ncbi:HNH endonuclease signature motif containing protein [Salipiger thiooxidans]|uniref:HNH endonuclease signature motif containing protein n=1 Tax=Salipiger thiooxidans TaxID=282683 RepID=UPI001CD3E094|nr:HNH endonuclease [Salipiger thiooxidans]MCA0847198.1 HNH endonuclease [Salipiger thiooxidans]
MPSSAPRICRCGRKILSGSRCECEAARDAERKARFDRKRPNSSQRGYGGTWERAAKAFLQRRENRQCKWPRCDQQAQHVDHIVPHKGDPALRDDPKNWQGLCAHHHNSAKQRLERRVYKRT